MKQAIGELNGTVIVFSAVAMLTAVFFMIIWPLVKDGFRQDEMCSNAVCANGYDDATFMTPCYNPQDPARTIFECPFRG